MNKEYTSYAKIQEAAKLAAGHLLAHPPRIGPIPIYGVPRGGASAALAIKACHPNYFTIVDNALSADFIIDDIVDSGETAKRFAQHYPAKPFVALFGKGEPSDRVWWAKTAEAWLVFPWELNDEAEGPAANVTRLLQFVGEDPNRGGLLETPARYLKALTAMTSGYKLQPHDVLKTFVDGAEGCDEMVMVRDIPFYSMCEHHMAPFFGTEMLGRRCDYHRSSPLHGAARYLQTGFDNGDQLDARRSLR